MGIAWEISDGKGFLCPSAGVAELTETVAAWDRLAREVPAVSSSKALTERLGALPELTPSDLDFVNEERLKMLLSFLVQAYVWIGPARAKEEPPKCVPSSLARPLVEVSKRLGEPPIFNYADYVLRNWRQVSTNQGTLDFSDLEVLYAFSDADDEKSFTLVHVLYELEANEILKAIESFTALQDRASDTDLGQALGTIGTSLARMQRIFLRVVESVSSEIFLSKIRIFLTGWKNNLPISYEGIDLDASQLRGETGAQSSVLPVVDAFLGSEAWDPHGSELSGHRAVYWEFVEYMPRAHRAFIQDLWSSSGLRTRMMDKASESTREAYRTCCERVWELRRTHLQTIRPYIGPTFAGGKQDVGTGGTDYKDYLGYTVSTSKASGKASTV